MKAALLIFTLSLSASGCGWDQDPDTKVNPRVLIVVVDGLRPDYVSPKLMPRLYARAQAGVTGLNHHAVFPTKTRVNGPSIFTGRNPSGHGILGNSIYLPSVDSTRVLDTGDREELQSIDRITSGGLLTSPSMGEILEENGLTFFAASSGSSGSGLLMNHTGSGAGLVHHAFTLPDTMNALVDEVLGLPPDLSQRQSSIPLAARAVDAILKIGLDRVDADVLAVWITEPDGTAHRTGVGSPETVKVLEQVDDEIDRLFRGLEERGVASTTNVLITSDHGFAQRRGEETLTDLLVNNGLKDSDESMDIMVAGNAIHVRQGGAERVAEIVRLLQQTEWIGPVFTRSGQGDGSPGSYPGTIAFSAIGWEHRRSADILTSASWSDALNEYGFAGTVLEPGVAGHGSASPWDIRATFIAFGPAFKVGFTSDLPTGNIDIMPTVFQIMDVQARAQFDGRVLRELLRNDPVLSSLESVTSSITAQTEVAGIHYDLTIYHERVESTSYFGGAVVTRTR